MIVESGRSVTTLGTQIVLTILDGCEHEDYRFEKKPFFIQPVISKDLQQAVEKWKPADCHLESIGLRGCEMLLSFRRN